MSSVLRKNPIDIVVYNVGGLSASTGGFVTVTDMPQQQAINGNPIRRLRLDNIVLPHMIERGAGVTVHNQFFRQCTDVSGPCPKLWT